MKEDTPSLLRDDLARKARTVAGACILFEEFAATLDLPLRAGPERILLHGHCHQKSMGMLAATRSLLSRIPSASVVELDAGCCGMAGSFGYTHYDVSVAIANRRLIPCGKSAMRAWRGDGRAGNILPEAGDGSCGASLRGIRGC